MDKGASVFDTRDFKISRRAYALECAFEYFIALLVADAFIAKLLKHLGASDALCGVISSFGCLAFVFQIVNVFVAGKIRNTKKFAVPIHTCAQFLFSCLYLIPFLPFDDSVRRVVFVICIFLSYFGNYFVTAIVFKWGNSFVDPRKRGSFSSVKEMISLISGMVVSLSLGYAIENLDKSGNVTYGFLLSACCMLVFCVSDFICLMTIRKEYVPQENEEEKPEPPKFRDVMKNTLGNRNFIKITVLHCLWAAAVFFTTGFLGTYKQQELMYTMGQIQLINISGVLVRFFISKPFGRFTDRHSYVRGIELAFIIAAVAFGCNMFASPTLQWFIIVYTVLYNISGAGTAQNMLNITYGYVDSRYFVQASAIKRCMSGLTGFLASLLSGKLLAFVQENGNTLFGIHVYGQQVQSLVSLVIVIIAFVFSEVTLNRQKVMLQ
ncbi:MAG: MFS transporter [Clostridia bacterium]|nr:MFS transporter [Clostridia bacterium]